MSTKLLLSVLLLPASTLALIGRDQSAGVEGILMCGTGPAKDVLVKLYDDDSGTTKATFYVFKELLFWLSNE